MRVAAERLGVGTIRGSGAHGGELHRKGGVSAFREMLGALEEGYNVALTADVPKVARVAGLGIVKLAQHSGRPIYPVAIATSRRMELNNWDRTAINLPFGRGAGVAGEPIACRADADDAALEARAARGRERRSTPRPRAPTRSSTATRGRSVVAERLPLTLRAYRLLTAAATPFAPLLAGASAQTRQGTSGSASRERRGESTHRASGRSAGLGARRKRRRTAGGAAADRAHPRAATSACWCTSGTVTSGGSRRAAAAARASSISSCRSTRRASSTASSTTGGPIWRCSSNPICGRT